MFTAVIRLDSQPEFLSATHAAAPELLTALQILVDALSRGADTVATKQATKQARATIAKAQAA